MTGPGLTVVTLVRDRNTMLERLVGGLERTEGVDVELVVVRAGGHEDPRSVAGGRGHVVVTHVDLGPCPGGIPYSAARNAGAAAAASDLLCFLDADMVPSASLPNSIVDCLRTHDVLARGEVRYLAIGVDGSEHEALLRRRSRPHPVQPPVPRSGIRLAARHELVWGQYFALRRTTFERVGGFDEGYRGYAGEDTDLAERLRRAGVDAALVGDAVAFHQHHDWFDPPVHQLRATIANAQHFRDRLGYWPMRGWLDRFEQLGLVAWDGDVCRVVDDPDEELIDRCRRRLPPPYAALTD